MEIFNAENLSFTYVNQKNPALSGVSFSVCEGEFVTLCGPTGSGKSTLLKLMKKEITPKGELYGRLCFKGRPIEEISDRESAESIGYIMQRPEEQIVSDRVGSELLFAPEVLGYDKQKAFCRVAEVSDFFGLSDMFEKRTHDLSGGQKQLLTLASALVCSPSVLLLDEPTSRLDPPAAAEFLSMLSSINRKLGITVVIAEHDISNILEYTDRLIFIEGGRLTADGDPHSVLSKKPSDAVLSDMPSYVRMFFERNADGICPLNVKEGRKLFSGLPSDEPGNASFGSSCTLDMKNVYFRYKRDLPDVLSGVDLRVSEGEIRFVFGGNGCGKSTLLHCAAGLYKPYSGKISVFDKNVREYKNGTLYQNNVSLLTQDVYAVFTHETVRDEFKGFDIKDLPYDLSELLDRHPYDLSGGQVQMAALCRVLAAKPRLLLLDEPTKGMDARYKGILADTLKKLKKEGVAVVAVTHDTEFASICADSCSMMFSGKIVCTLPVRDFIKENKFYTTDACRMTGGKMI